MQFYRVHAHIDLIHTYTVCLYKCGWDMKIFASKRTPANMSVFHAY